MEQQWSHVRDELVLVIPSTPSTPTAPAQEEVTDSTIPEAVVPRSERVAQERLELKEWSKATPDHLRQRQAEDRVFPSQDHMNIEELMCEMGLHFLYDWEGVYTPEKRSEVIQMHMDKHATNSIDGVLGVQANRDFIDSVISDLYELWSGDAAPAFHLGLASVPTTFEQFELSLPRNGLKNKLMRVINSTNHWGHTYVQTDKLEYRNIATMFDVRDDYNFEEEAAEEEDSGFVFDPDGAYPMMDENHMTDHEIEERIRQMGPQNVFNDDSDDSDEEEGMSNEERKEMCGKGLEILETVMEKDDQRLCEGDFVELCNLLKELHRT
jgi:hypothetical protein